MPFRQRGTKAWDVTVNAFVCGAYSGDQSCSLRLPILCINRNKSFEFPGEIPPGNYKWSGREIKISKEILGSRLSSLDAANQVCQKQFGSDWALAEHHDAWGWGLIGKGEIKTKTRFWVYINDQPANCWNNRPADLFHDSLIKEYKDAPFDSEYDENEVE